MNSTIENTKRQSLTKLAGFGFVKQIASALVVAVCCLSAVAEAEDIIEDRTLTQNTTIENISVGFSVNQKTITIQGSAVTLTLNNTEDSHFCGIIAGTGNVVKTGTGTLYLTYEFPRMTYSANLGYLGTTTISEGTLKLDNVNEALYNSSQVINNGVIETNCGQTFNNLIGTGTIKVTSPALLSVINSTDTTYEGSITGPASLTVERGKKLTLSGSISDLVRIEVDFGSQLELTGAALDYNGIMRVFGGKSIEYNVANGVQRYNITTEANKIDVENTPTGGADSGKLIKSGDGTLKICCEAKGLVRADSVFISSGRMDYQGYFYSELGPISRGSSGWVSTDIVVVESGATLSPGDSIGSMILTQGNVKIKESATLLFEFDAYNEAPTQQNFDTLVIADSFYSFTPESGSIIDLAFLNNDATEWATEGAEYRLVTDQGFANGNYDYLLPEKYRSMFSLQGKNGNGLYLIGLGAPEPEPVVPEPSTWALMILGVAGLICVQLRKKK